MKRFGGTHFDAAPFEEIAVVVVPHYLSSSHKTGSNANDWTIRTHIIAVTFHDPHTYYSGNVPETKCYRWPLKNVKAKD